MESHLGRSRLSSDEAVPYDACSLFTFKIWEHYKPDILNEIFCFAYLLSPDPVIMDFPSKPENRESLDRLAHEMLIS